MILDDLGLYFTETQISHILGTREGGTPGYAVKNLATVGLRATYQSWSISQLLVALDQGRPVILFVRTGFLDHWKEDLAHAVVAVGYQEEQAFLIHDPALVAGPTAVSWNGLLAAWIEFRYRATTIERT